MPPLFVPFRVINTYDCPAVGDGKLGVPHIEGKPPVSPVAGLLNDAGKVKCS
jgi:hypothetical protein